MHTHRSPSALLLVAAMLATMMAATAADAARRHTRLVRSIPGRDSVVTVVPRQLQLWFSEPIELAVSRVRLAGPSAELRQLAPLGRASADASAPVTAPLPDSLAAGRYTVHWSTASKDGHVVRDSFAFTIRR
jgi:methionine-rich copper-binding protein CopC